MKNEMQKYISIFFLFILFCAFSGPGDAQCQAIQHRMLVILSELGDPYQSAFDFTISELSRLGYVQDKNFSFKLYSLDHYKGRTKRILMLEAANRYDLIVVFGTIGTIALKDIILDDPEYEKIVFSCVTDPVGAGVIDDFVSPPTHNFTGVTYAVPVAERIHFIKRVMPQARKIGLIYADMPQSHGYNNWLRDCLKNDARCDGYEILFRSVPFVESQGGMIRMTIESVRHIKELDQKVDLFLSANDQLASHSLFPQKVCALSEKPLVGLNKKDVMEARGATMAIFPTPEGIGRQTAKIIHRLLEGASVKDVLPEEVNEFGVAFDLVKAKQFGIHIPEDLLQRAGNNIINAELIQGH